MTCLSPSNHDDQSEALYQSNNLVQQQSAVVQANQTLRESEERCRAIIEQISEGLLLIDLETKQVLQANAAVQNLLGYTSEEILKLTLDEIVVDTIENLEHNIQHILEKVHYKVGERKYRHKNGGLVDVEVNVSLIAYSEKTAFCVTVRDISERKTAEAALRTSEIRNQALLNAIPDLIIRMTRSGYYLDFKPAKNFKTVMSDCDIQGKRLQEVMPQEIVQQRLYYVEQALDTGELQIYEYQLQIEGELYYEEARIIASGADEVILIIRDITERKRIEAELQQAKAELEAKVQERTAELREANHQLQTEILERKQAEQLTRERSCLSALQADVGFALIQSDSLHRILQQCTEALVKHLDAAFARIWTLNSEENMLELQASAGLYTHLDGAHSRVPVGRFKIGRIAQTQQPHLTNQIMGDSQIHDQAWAMQQGMVAFAGYPLIVGGQVVGVVALFARQPMPSITLQALASVANMIALGIQHHRLEVERLKLMAQELIARTEAEAAQKRVVHVLESITDGFFTLDREWCFTYLNQQAERLLQTTQTSLIGKSIWQEFSEAANLAFYAQYHKAMATQRSVSFEGFYPPLNTWFTIHAYPAPTGLSVYFHDITQRRNAEIALRQSEERYRAIVEDQTDLITRFRLDGTLIFVNEAYCRYFGLNREEVITSNYQSLVFEEDQSQVAQMLNSLSWDNPLVIIENRVIAKGQVRWTQWQNRALFDEQGKLVEFQSVGRDITDRKRAEEEVRFLQTMTEAIYESDNFQAALGIALQKVGEATGWSFGEAWIPNAENNVLECSPAWYGDDSNLKKFREVSQQMTFALGAGLPGRVWNSKRPEWLRDVSAESIQIYLRAEVAQEVGLKAGLGIPILNDGTVIAVLVFYMFEPHDEDIRLIELIAASTQLGLIIQRKRVEEEVRQALKRERELNELKSRFVSMTSHEFRTPLSVISLSAGMLENYSHRWDSERKAQHFQRIQTSIQQMIRLLDDVLFIGKEDAGKIVLKLVPLQLKAFCRELVEEMQLAATTQHFLIFESEGHDAEVYLDEKLLRQILSNLLSNAIKYSPQGSTVSLKLIHQTEAAVFQVQDSGIGIPLEEQHALFESFYRASNVGSISGTGLGLAIVKKSVDLHKGQITVESQVDSGTTFTVMLPLQPSSPSQSL